jgi:hypothetical protein
MHPDIEAAARENLAAVLTSVTPESLEPDLALTGAYGLTSLNKVLFLTSVCQDTGVDLAHFTEDDLATMNTLRECVDVLSRYAPGA